MVIRDPRLLRTPEYVPIWYHWLYFKATEGAKLLDGFDVRIQLSYTSASGKRKGNIIEDLDNESLKSEEGHVAQRTNTPESRFRAIFFKGIKF